MDDSERAAPAGAALRIPRARPAGALLLSAAAQNKKATRGWLFAFVSLARGGLELWPGSLIFKRFALSTIKICPQTCPQKIFLTAGKKHFEAHLTVRNRSSSSQGNDGLPAR